MDKNQILHLAKLSRLDLTDEEVATFPAQFEAILSFVDQIKNVEVPEGVVRDMQNYNSFRVDDVTHESGDHREEIIDAFPDRDGDYLQVSKVLPN